MTGKAKRSYGSGSLIEKTDAWYGKWRTNGEQVKRKLGPKRAPGSRDGLTRTQAEAEMRRLIAEVKPVRRVGDRLTIDELSTRYRAQQKRLGRKKAAIVAVESVTRVWLVPYFGDRPVDTIRTEDVADLMTMMEDGRRPGHAGKPRVLSTKTVRNYIITLSALLNFAEAKGWTPTNPARHVDLPAREALTEDVRYLDPAEIDALTAAVPLASEHGAVDRAMYVTAAMTGLRQGELVALRWRDVDWIAARVRVRQSYVLGEFGTPKSRRSTRSVPMADPVIAELDRLSKATRWGGEDDLVFAHPVTGEPLHKGEILKRYRKALKAAKLDESHVFHDLRHTFGTRMAAAGVPMRTLQEWMGHRDLETTQRYADYAPSAHEAAFIAAAFGPAHAEHPARV